MSFNPADRAREKQEAREADERALADGTISKEELAKRNGFFSSLDFSGSSIVWKGDAHMAPRDHFLKNSTPPAVVPPKRRPIAAFLTLIGILFIASIALSGLLDMMGI